MVFSVSENNLDDLMRAIFRQLLNGRGNYRVESKKGTITEVFGALLELRNPRARLSRSQSRARLFSALGEFFWYLAGNQNIDFIEYYIPRYRKFSNDGKIANGAYGPRIFGLDAEQRALGSSEWDRVIKTLKSRAGSRNAVVQIYSNEDAFEGNEDKPCTCTLQFAIRNNKLMLHTHMRSNDAFMGLPHDIFSFTLLQELAARELEVGLGTYKHSVASLHLYDDKPEDEDGPAVLSKTEAKRFLNEGFHEHRPMPEMPLGNPWPSLEKLIAIEANCRAGICEDVHEAGLEPYWGDFASLLEIHAIIEEVRRNEKSDPSTRRSLRRVASIVHSMSSPVYRLYVQDRLAKRETPVRDLFQHAEKEA